MENPNPPRQARSVYRKRPDTQTNLNTDFWPAEDPFEGNAPSISQLKTSPRDQENKNSDPGSRQSPAVSTLEFLKLLAQPGEVTEIFVLGPPRPEYSSTINWSGYYNFAHLEQLVDDVLVHSGHAQGIYYRINVLDSKTLDRSPNRLQRSKYVQFGKANDITRRRILFIDVDPQRPPDTSATEQEKQSAKAKVEEIRTYLHGQGWPNPIFGASGNGYFLLFRVDLPTDDGGLVQRVLRSLASRFNDEQVHVDVSVHDAARLARLPGTLNCKGDNSSTRPHRMCHVANIPCASWELVPHNMLEGVANEGPPMIAPIPRGVDTAELREVLEKAGNYVRRMPAAISGEGGHTATFTVAMRLIVGFDLTPDHAWSIMLAYNQRCIPPWTEEELWRKLVEADRMASADGRPRGGLRRYQTSRSPEYAGWEPLPGKAFHGWIPDFGDADREILMSLERFASLPWHWWYDYFALWKTQFSHPLIPDISLRQLRWGANWPRNWLRDLKVMRGTPVLEVAYGHINLKPVCLLCGTNVRHRHFSTLLSDWGILAEIGPQEIPDDELSIPYIPYDCRGFALYTASCAEELQHARKTSFILPAYWPALLLGSSPRIGWNHATQRLLVGIVRERTRDQHTPRKDEIIRGSRIASASTGDSTVVCPLLDRNQEYVVFGGNGRRPGRGYRIVGETFGGWLHRAGYRRVDEFDSSGDRQTVKQFLTNLARLTADLDIIVVGYHPKHSTHQWRGIKDLQHCLRTSGGREWLAECMLRIFAPTDYLTRWRYFFSRKMGFSWIPKSVDDTGPTTEKLGVDPEEIRTGDQVRAWLKKCNFIQDDLAMMLSLVLGRPVSRQRVNRLIGGKCNNPELFEQINKLRRVELEMSQASSLLASA